MKEMTCYTFVYGVDGFGADVSPAYEYGVYTDFDKAFAKQMELNSEIFAKEGGYEYWETDRTNGGEHYKIIKKLEKACKRINLRDEPPFGWYQLVETVLFFQD